MNNAWADLLDARTRLVHGWRSEGLGLEEMLERLHVSDDELQQLVLASPEPPRPGCSRDQLRLWVKRAKDLEIELREAAARPVPGRAPSEPPRASYVRALLSDPDPARCGCRYWIGTERPGVAHHQHCEHEESGT